MKLKAAVIVCLITAMGFTIQGGEPFGTEEDIDFANKVWKVMLEKHKILESNFLKGEPKGIPPHGEIYYPYTDLVRVDDKVYEVVISLDYAGEDLSIDSVRKYPIKYMTGVTMMVDREEGYDEETNNYFWIQYDSKGVIQKNEEGVALAGKVGKGMEKGCSPCHSTAKDGDYIFSDD